MRGTEQNDRNLELNERPESARHQSGSVLATGTTISHYRILQKLGHGGMGVVYKAEDTLLERIVALKFLPDELAHDGDSRERFLREARAASALSHPNICTVYDVGEEDGRTFIAMEFLDGLTLNEVLTAGPMETGKLLDVAIQVTEGLQEAHRRGVIHRDIKLANIMLTGEGRAKILDFGIAKKIAKKHPAVADAGPQSAEEAQQTSGLAPLGTAAYMSPEQALGQVLDERSDLFSFGVVLYQMATSDAPFCGDTTGTLFLSIVQGTPVPAKELNADVPSELQAIITKCLEKYRELRYQDAAELRADLRSLQMKLGKAPTDCESPDEEAEFERPAPSRLRPQSDHATDSSLGRLHSSATPTVRGRQSKRRLWRLITVLAGVIAVTAVAVVTVHYRHAAAPVHHASIVLSDFTNSTGDAVFDGSLRQALATSLGQSPFLNVVPDTRVAAVLKLMDKPAGQRLTYEIAREVCLRTNSLALVAGSISQEGDQYRIELKAINCGQDKVIASTQAVANNRDAVISALGRGARTLRANLGESLQSLDKFDKPLPEATTNSLEALQAYATGRSVRTSSADAIPYLKRAIALDHNFAMAYLALGTAYANSGQEDLGKENYAKAFEFRNRATEEERVQIESVYYRDVTGQTEKAVSACEEGIKSYPQSARLQTTLGFSYLDFGEFDKAVQSFQKTKQLVPERAAPYVNLVAAYVFLNRPDEAKAAFEEARKRGIDDEALHENRYLVAFVENDSTAMREQVEWAKGKPGYEDVLLALSSDTEAFYGRFAKARELDKQAQSSAELADGQERIAGYLANAAWREVEVGNVSAARRLALIALQKQEYRLTRAKAAMALARAGYVSSASRAADDLAQKYPLDTLLQTYLIPTIRASIYLQRGSGGKAIETLQPALKLELTGVPFGMEATYIRGLAYMQQRDGSDAVKEFQKLIAHPGIVENSITGSLVYLQLARAEQLAGDFEAARTDYQTFLSLWQDSDPDIPALKQAKAEYAQLK